MTRAFFGLGSNLGDRAATLRSAVAGIAADPLIERAVASPVYETEPVGGPEDQGAYLNLVVEVHTAATPRQLLLLAQRLENEAGRVRTVRWGARTLDVDVLWIDGVTVDEPDLVVPHPRLFERAFVLAPLADLAADVAETEGDWRATVTMAGVRLAGPLEER